MDEIKFCDCFANPAKTKYTKNCVILREKLCETRGDCPFYKTKKQFEEDVKRAEKLYYKHYNGC